MLVSEGHSYPLGPSVVSSRKNKTGQYVQTVNIAVLSRVADTTLCLFQPLRKADILSSSLYIRDIWKHIEFPGRTGRVVHARLDDFPHGTAYAICVNTGNNTHRLLTDPYAPCIESCGSAEWMRVPGERLTHHGTAPSTTSVVENVHKMLASFPTLRGLGITTLFRPALFEDEWSGGDDHRRASFDWDGHEQVSTPVPDGKLVIYEAHARALGADGSLEAAALRAPYLRWLGVKAVQLMPVLEFAEAEVGSTEKGEEYIILTSHQDNSSIQRSGNHWGYAPLSFFAPMNRYSRRAVSGGPTALKTFVREMHKHGILVFLDVVYNHTANASCAFHFLGVQHDYYLEQDDSNDGDDDGMKKEEKDKKLQKLFKHCNYSGCGNTIAANKPHGQDLILRSLKHLVRTYHVDGFRIDAAGVLCRDARTGAPVPQPPVLDVIVNDAELADVQFVVEGWDAGDQIGSPNFMFGSFPHGDRFREWNAPWRDYVRRFFRDVSTAAAAVSSAPGSVVAGNDVDNADAVQHGFRQALCGMPQVYQSEGGRRLHGVIFVSCHDGLCLADVVSYSARTNTDGYDEVCFDCSNGGFGGQSDNGADNTDGAVVTVATRTRMMRNLVLSLLVSSGVPMLTQGDELGFTKNGHSNTWNQPQVYAAMLPAQPQLCTNKDGFVQYVRTLLKLRARVGGVVATLDHGHCLTWVDADGEESVGTIEEEAAKRSSGNSCAGHEGKTGKTSSNQGGTDCDVEHAVKMDKIRAAGDVDGDKIKQKGDNERCLKEQKGLTSTSTSGGGRSNIVAFMRPSKKMVDKQRCAVNEDVDKNSALCDAVYVAFNSGVDDVDVKLPGYGPGHMVTWTYELNTHSANWKQDTRRRWQSGELVKLQGQAAILFTGKLHTLLP